MQRFENIKSPIRCLAWSPDGVALLAAYRNGLMLGGWNLETVKFHRWHPCVDRPVSSFAYSPCGRYLAVGSVAGLGMIGPIGDKNGSLSQIDTGECVYAMSWAPRSLTNPALATASRGLWLWSLDSQDDGIDLLGSEQPYTALAWSADECWLAVVNGDVGGIEAVRLNDRLTGIYEHFVEEFPLDIWGASLCFAPAGTREQAELAATGGGDLRIYRLERAKGFTAVRGIVGQVGKATQAVYHPGGKILAVGCADGVVGYWDATSLQQITSYNWKVGAINALAFAPDGMRCAVGGSTGTVVIWDVDR